ncbi:hypothetical protein P154DRAFT_532431 [Amniculicola lignicola CBS 123094]|uniref:Uncharacterized protein n=1 Tax=Amniculicola lignicola CBS 123094 TaxID=1392246 RepID=A0A6A5WQI5_9PLEO|nr:hypothetical protein P154DRAFT_532431 [Amniculicola lignicola CBS 123094]
MRGSRSCKPGHGQTPPLSRDTGGPEKLATIIGNRVDGRCERAAIWRYHDGACGQRQGREASAPPSDTDDLSMTLDSEADNRELDEDSGKFSNAAEGMERNESDDTAESEDEVEVDHDDKVFDDEYGLHAYGLLVYPAPGDPGKYVRALNVASKTKREVVTLESALSLARTLSLAASPADAPRFLR